LLEVLAVAAVGAESFARREWAAMPARPTPQSRRNQRRESWRAWARRSSAEKFMSREKYFLGNL
jgi:hypothetical protein